MKNMIAAILLFTGASAFPCSQQEAQFIGKVVNQSKSQDGSCAFEIKFSMYNISMVCPLDEDEVAGTKFVDPKCSMKNGDAISGYLVKKDGGSVYIE